MIIAQRASWRASGLWEFRTKKVGRSNNVLRQQSGRKGVCDKLGRGTALGPPPMRAFASNLHCNESSFSQCLKKK